MKWFVLFFIINVIFLYGRSSHTDNPPEAYVGGMVNVITGELFLMEEDLSVEGAVSLSIGRTYTGIYGNGEWHFFENHIAYVYTKHDEIHIPESHGGVYVYQRAKGAWNRFEIRDPPLTNASGGKLAARTNLKNQYALVKSHWKYLVVVTPSGTQRVYRRFHGDYIGEDVRTTNEHFPYFLKEEILSSGHRVRYARDDDNRLTKITTYDPSGYKLLSSVEVKTHGKVKKEKLQKYETNRNFEMRGSDKRKVSYNFFSKGEGRKTCWHLERVSSSLYPSVDYHYFKPKIQYSKRHVRQISCILYPDSRFLQIDYFGHKKEFAIRNRVKRLIAPVGEEGEPHATHSFDYDLENRTTTVREIGGSFTRYKWDEKERLIAIERCFGDGRLATITRFVWGSRDIEEGNLIARVYQNGNGALHSLCRYFYDAAGNVIEERFYGDLSGEGPALRLNANNLPSAESGEYHSKKMCYSKDGKHLLLSVEESGLTTTYTYLPGTDLLTEEAFSDDKGLIKRHKLIYNGDNLLVREETHDGPATLVTEYLRRPRLPFYGLVDTQIEKYVEAGEEHLLQKRVFAYSENGQVVEECLFDSQEKHVYTLSYKYDEKGRLIEETNPHGEKAKRAYDKIGNCIAYKEFGHCKPKLMRYSTVNRLTHLYEFNRETQHIYDLRGNEVKTIDPYRYVTSYHYDSLDRPVAIEQPPLSEKAAITRRTYDDFGRLIEEQDPNGHITKTSYNSFDKPTRIIYPDRSEEHFIYAKDGTLTTSIDQNGTETHYTYDAQKNLIFKKRGEAEERYTYKGSYLTAYTDPEGHTTTYRYDGAGRKIAEEQNRERIEFQYDSFGRISCEKRGDLLTITEYDHLNQVTATVRKGSDGTLYAEERYRYDAMGNHIETSYPHGDERFDYDVYSRLTKKIDPLGAETRIEYADDIHTVTTIDPLGLTTTEKYNGHYLVDLMERATCRQIFSYDPAENLTREVIEIPERSVTTLWAYDALNRCISQTKAAGTPLERTTAYTYTLTGELQALYKPNGIVLYHDYDLYGNLVEQSASDGNLHYQFIYDLNGNLTQCSDLIGGTTHIRSYDAKKRLISETLPSGLELTHRYDEAGRRVQLILPDGSPIDYEYDACHLISVARPFYEHRYLEYDLSGNPINQQLISGHDSLKSAYDAKNRCVRFVGPSFLHKITEFDAAGNILATSLNGQEQTYRYDELYQLTEEKEHIYCYDALYNRLQKDTKHYTTNELNELPSLFDYDESGLPLSQKNTTYRFDPLDRLIEVSTGDTLHTYTYDSLNRRMSKTITGNGRQTTQHFFYDDQKEIGTTDEEGRMVELRVLGYTPRGEMGAAVALELGSETYIPLHDLHGNLVAIRPLKDPNGESYRYTAFGEEKTPPSPLSPWRFASKRTDETGLVYFGRRYYIPSLGRWLTPDPLGDEAGPNLYAYLSNSPLNRYDEYGLYDISYFDDIVNNPHLYSCKFDLQHELNSMKGMVHGPIEYGLRFLHDIQSQFSYMGAFSDFDFDLDERLQMVKQVEQSQIEQKAHIDHWIQQKLSVDPSNQAYQEARDWSRGVCEFVSIELMGWGLVKGVSKFRNIGTFVSHGSNFFSAEKTIIKGVEQTNIIWTATKQRTSLKNAFWHWESHGRDFPSIMNAKQYAQSARAFINNPPEGTLIKIRANGDKILYNPQTNWFAVSNVEGVPKTLYKPSLNRHPYSTNLEYFNAQK